jgi:hypothetical protein
MKIRIVVAGALGIAIGGLGTIAQADEAEIIRATCEKVMTRSKVDSQPERIEALCKINRSSLDYWQCMDKRTLQGQSFANAGVRCHSVS